MLGPLHQPLWQCVVLAGESCILSFNIHIQCIGKSQLNSHGFNQYTNHQVGSNLRQAAYAVTMTNQHPFTITIQHLYT